MTDSGCLRVNAMYYVGFTICTLSASFIFYQGLNTDDVTNILSLICGFLLEFVGIALLTLSRRDGKRHPHRRVVKRRRSEQYRAVAGDDDDDDVELRSI